MAPARSDYPQRMTATPASGPFRASLRVRAPGIAVIVDGLGSVTLVGSARELVATEPGASATTTAPGASSTAASQPEGTPR